MLSETVAWHDFLRWILSESLPICDSRRKSVSGSIPLFHRQPDLAQRPLDTAAVEQPIKNVSDGNGRQSAEILLAAGTPSEKLQAVPE
jgi:hypothetical protein